MTLWNCIFFKNFTAHCLKTITLIYIILKICWITTDFFSFKNSIFTCISINLKVYLFGNKWHSTGGFEFFCNKSCYECYVHIYNIHMFFFVKISKNIFQRQTKQCMYMYSVQTKINMINCHKNRLPVIKIYSKNFSDRGISWMNRLFQVSYYC